jgi:hypothetical protein
MQSRTVAAQHHHSAHMRAVHRPRAGTCAIPLTTRVGPKRRSTVRTSRPSARPMSGARIGLTPTLSPQRSLRIRAPPTLRVPIPRRVLPHTMHRRRLHATAHLARHPSVGAMTAPHGLTAPATRHHRTPQLRPRRAARSGLDLQRPSKMPLTTLGATTAAIASLPPQISQVHRTGLVSRPNAAAATQTTHRRGPAPGSMHSENSPRSRAACVCPNA